MLTLKQGMNKIQLNRPVPEDLSTKEEFEKNAYKYAGPEFGGISIKALKLVPVN